MRDRIKIVINEIYNIRDELIPDYDPLYIHFKQGDIVWCMFDETPIQVMIDEVQDFGEGAYKFYWIKTLNIKWYEKLWEHIKFRLWIHFTVHLKFRQPSINPKFGPGHAVLPGRGETIFRTKQEAILDNNLTNAIYDLHDTLYELNQ